MYPPGRFAINDAWPTTDVHLPPPPPTTLAAPKKSQFFSIMIFRIPSLEYSLSHPHPKGRVFLIATVVIFLLTLPVLILVNLITQGSELVPSLQTQYQPNDILVEGWWGANRLPSWFRPKTPLCQPKDIGRGDTFRLTTSLFDYTVMSTLNASEHGGTVRVDEQIRPEYRGENFSSCYVNSARFDYNLFEQTQTVMVGVFCPGFPHDQVNVSMQTTMTFAWELSKDFIGQYYGPGLDLLSLNDTNPSDYRKVVLAVLEVISTDSLTIMHKPHLSNPAGSIRIAFKVNATTGVWKDDASTLTYLNGTQPEGYPPEANIYGRSIANLVTVAMSAVALDLGSYRFPNIFRNATYMKRAINPNLPPSGINSTNWAEGSRTFYYGSLTGYETWADTLLHEQPVKVGDLTGLPVNGSAMATTYLCPTYRVKPLNSFLSSVFVGSATMTLSVWGVWMFFTAFVAKKIMAPRVQCQCASCHKRRAKEEGDKCDCGDCHLRKVKERGETCACEECEKVRKQEAEMGAEQSGPVKLVRLMSMSRRKNSAGTIDEEKASDHSGASDSQRPTHSLHNKHRSEFSTYTIEEEEKK